VARAHGRETTYQADLVTPEEIRAAIDELAARVVDDVRAEDRAVQRVFLKIRFAPFFTFTRVRKLGEPTFDVEVIAQTAFDLYTALDDQRPVRLLGVRGEMVPPEGGY
jgi:DNA polymerase-4